ncbi:unnamed protein product [Heterobilharzia americana]|nr:unnamed protein product [Heterobilharzia americana]
MNSFLCMQQSLEQALVTSIFTTALHIQNSIILRISNISNCLTSSDFMNLFTKALGRILISRTQLPEAGVAVDVLVTYLLRLFNEEPLLLNSCLAVLPPMDYESAVLDLTKPFTFRLLNRPIAVQEDDRATAVAARFNEAESMLKSLSSSHPETMAKQSKQSDSLVISSNSACPPYHYPAHCSNEAIVLHFLIRLPPYTFRHLRFQDNNFDVPDRLFHSVATTWRLATTSASCVKELVPEFYFQPEMFINRSGLKLGCRQPGDSVDCVELPPWCKNDPRLFTLICRAALESDYVSVNLSHWIDLLFGFKQIGKNAKDALNLYHPYTYFGAIDVDTIADPLLAQAVEAMISNYGQTPKQLFHKYPHPCRQLSIYGRGVLNLLPNFETSATQEKDDNCSTLQSCNSSNAGKLIRTTSPSRLDNTPLETVIGLKWGTWAGSPQIEYCGIIWKKQLVSIKSSTPSSASTTTGDLVSHSDIEIPLMSYLTGSAWCEFTQQKSATSHCANQLDKITSLTSDELYHSWDGWVDFNMDYYTNNYLPTSSSMSPSSSVSTDRTTTPYVNAEISWHWKILLCESNARVWISLLADFNDNQYQQSLVPYMIKLKPSSVDNKMLTIFMKRLDSMSVNNTSASDNDDHKDTGNHESYECINLQLPCPCIQLNATKTFITSLAISPSSSLGIQLFVGTCLGSIYVRQLPTNLMDISLYNGWLPQDYQDISVWDETKLHRHRPIKNIKTGTKCSKSNIRQEDENTTDNEFNLKEAGLWEITGWKQLTGHAGNEITVLVINRNNSLIASGDDQGHVCLWDRYRLSLIKAIDTSVSIDSGTVSTEYSNASGQVSKQSSCNPVLEKPVKTNNENVEVNGSGNTTSRSSTSHHSSTRSSSCSSTAESMNINIDQMLNSFKRVDGICFSLTSGELVVAKWNQYNYHVCWLGVYACSGVRIATRILDFMAEINDPLVDFPYSQISDIHPPVPMAFSSVSEGRGVNCLLLGGPGGRLVWLNSWTLDTVRTYLLPDNNQNSRITSLCFGPLANTNSTNSNNYQLSSKDLGEILCQGLYVVNQTGCVYHFGPNSALHETSENADSDSLNSYELYKPYIAFWLDD